MLLQQKKFVQHENVFFLGIVLFSRVFDYREMVAGKNNCNGRNRLCTGIEQETKEFIGSGGVNVENESDK